MENAVKALLIAAGIFLVILILSLAMAFYQKVTDFYNAEHERTVIEQTQKFNAQFENYNREKIRGSDIISLMNKVIDYNASQSYQEGTNYKRIKVNIELGGNNILEQFRYSEDSITEKNRHLKSSITNTVGADNWSSDRNLVELTQTSDDLIKKAKEKLNIDITDTQLQQIASNISNLIIDENSETVTAINNRVFRAEMIKELLDLPILIDENTAKTKTVADRNKINVIQEIASQYYQYMQFKRAYFDCKKVLYDDETNRVESMKFELRIKDGNVVFD